MDLKVQILKNELPKEKRRELKEKLNNDLGTSFKKIKIKTKKKI